MQRYNIFFPVHKALKAMLFETALLLQQTDFTDDDEATTAIEQLKTITLLFSGHADKEDNYVFNAILAYEPSVVAAFEEEHVQDYQLGASLEKWIAAFDSAESYADTETIGEELVRAYTEFLVFNLNHMAKEEAIISPILWRYYTDQELQNITSRIMKAVPKEEMQLLSRWMITGLNSTELIYWLSGVKQTAPAMVFNNLLMAARHTLAPHRWQLVQEALEEEVIA